MKIKITFLFAVLLFPVQALFSQTSWKGITSTSWTTSSNWTAGVPTSAVDAIIGDANFTGPFQPALSGGTANCKNLTIGTGSIVSALSVSRNINLYGDLVIGSNGSILQNSANRTITIKGNWTNNGTYSAIASNSTVRFSGTAQTISGSAVFDNLTINSGCTVTLASNISINGLFSVSGIFDPTASCTVSGAGSLTVNSNGTILVKAAALAGNYTLTGGLNLSGTSTVNYASSLINQNISAAYSYGFLRISGGTTKYLIANLPQLNSSSSSSGRIYIDAGTFDMQAYTADRGTGTVGGYFTIAAGTFLKIGGTNSFPANFNSVTIASNSTVDYDGNNQAIAKYSYGNLTFESTSSTAVKTMPVLAMTIAGNFTSQAGAGSGVTFTAGNNLTVNLNVSLDATTVFDGGSYSHVFKGSWTNNGTFTGNASTVNFTGINAVLSGTGANNFYNLTFSGAGQTATGITNLNVAGNLTTSGTGSFTHGVNGTVTLSGAAKTINGNGFAFYNCLVTGSITTTRNFSVAGDFTVNGTFTASSASVIILNGISKTIAGSGSITFYSLNILGTVSTAINFTMLRDFTVALSGSFSASNGTCTFNGTSNLAGTCNLFNVTVNAVKTLSMGTNAVLGIANVFVKNGTFNVTNNIPNMVNYNSPAAQSIINTPYNNLILSNGGTKTPAAGLTINNDFTISSGVIFNASSYTISLYRHFTNNGTFTAATSTMQLLGSNAATLTGSTTFNTLTENKSNASIAVTLANNFTASNLILTAGNMQTGINSITITATRSGAGIIIGTIIHSHAFVSGNAYYFEGPQNSITFTNPSASLTSVTVVAIPGTVSDFDPAVECVNREYQISIPAGTYTNATLSYHYEDNELNAFAEPFLSVYKFNSGIIWDSLGFTSRNSVSNFVTLSGITSLPGRYSASGIRNVVLWNGSVSSAWENAANWTTISGANMSNRIPASTDAAEIGEAVFTNNPVINSNQQIGLLKLGSVQPAVITINSGSLDDLGSFRGAWTSTAAHSFNVGSGTLSVGTTMDLGDGTPGHTIDLIIGSGTATIMKALTQNGGAINFSGNGMLSVYENFNYTSGTFSPGTGTVQYTGPELQIVAPLIYNNLSFTKSTNRAYLNSPVTVNGNFITTTGGEVELNSTLTVAGNITIGAGTNIIENGVTVNAGGNWTNNGLFTVSTGTVDFNGSGAQAVNANTFNQLVVNKATGTLALTGDLVVNSDFNIAAGTVDLSMYTANRSNTGGMLTMGASSLLKVGGANNFPQNFISDNLNPTATVEYNGTVAQTVFNISYGNLTFTNGGAAAKTFVDNTTVNGDFLINAGADVDPNNSTIALLGNFVNNGIFFPSGSTLKLDGLTKTLTGNTTFNSLLVTGSYVVSSGTTSMAGDLTVATGASLNFGSNATSLDGDLTVNGSLTSNGVATFTGTRVQTLQLMNAIVSSSTGVINFNGSVAPIMNSNTSPAFATVNINNTAGITPSVPWTVYFACNIAAGSSFNGGALTHTFYGNFTNNGTVTSSGELKFIPSPPFSAGATVTLDGTSFTSSGKVTFGGTSPLTIVDVNPSFNFVSVTNTSVSGITPPNAWTINDELFIASGATFNGGSGLSHILMGNMTNNGTLNGQTSTITFEGNPVEINGLGISNFYNLTIATAADLTIHRAINISRNFVDDGTFAAPGRTITFNGSTASTISGLAGSVTFDDLEQNKTSAITTLSVPVFVSNDLEMTSGIINTSAAALLTLYDNATSSQGTSTSFVDGPMKKIGNDTFVFPLGHGTIWARLEIGAPASVTDAYTAQYFSSAYANTSSMAVSPAPVLNNVSTIEYWTCSRTAGTSNVKVRLYWESASRSVIQNYTSDLVVARWNGSAWENAGQSAITASSPGNVTSNTVSSFTAFTFGSLSGASPLPVEFLNFTALLNADHRVDVLWSTATETNNDFFTIEKTKDGVNYETVGIVNGAGNSTQTLRYSSIDNFPYEGVSYYRLKQTDFNGRYSYSSIVAVTNDNSSDFSIDIYPNPGDGANLNVTITATEGQEIHISITDIAGKECFSENVTADQNGNEIHPVALPQQLSSGTYFISAFTEQKIYCRKFIVK